VAGALLVLLLLRGPEVEVATAAAEPVGLGEGGGRPEATEEAEGLGVDTGLSVGPPTRLLSSLELATAAAAAAASANRQWDAIL